ncbi:MAG: DUF4126 domain-containing protein [Fimbriimonadaceae bacterium]|nr:DUF4126 domain-containing protein [Fimbriimonadaceae bacterium]
MDGITAFALALGASWASGIRLYGAVATLGLLGRLGYVKLPGSMAIVENPWVLSIAGLMFLLEFVADKVPAVDSAWDAVHGFLRIPAGAVLAWSAFSDTDPAVQAIAVLLGGGLSFLAHAGKSATRLAANLSPEPFSNVALSLGEDAAAGVGLFTAAFIPAVGIGFVAVMVLLAVLIVRKAVTSMRTIRRGQAT